MKTWWAVAFSVVLTFLGIGLVFLITRQPRGEPIKLAPPPTLAPLLVHVTGAIASPGMYALPAGARTQDALVAAGGLLPDADAGLINLAAFLEDGQQVWVPWKQAVPEPAERGESIPNLPEGQPLLATPDPAWPININLATQTELESLPGIGPVIAQHIIEYRQQFGPFENIEEIQAVNGIGDAKFDQIKDYITVGQSP